MQILMSNDVFTNTNILRYHCFINRLNNTDISIEFRIYVEKIFMLNIPSMSSWTLFIHHCGNIAQAVYVYTRVREASLRYEIQEGCVNVL